MDESGIRNKLFTLTAEDTFQFTTGPSLSVVGHYVFVRKIAADPVQQDTIYRHVGFEVWELAWVPTWVLYRM